METPISDFAQQYAASHTARLHMPGHKGHGPLGCEALDITEIAGADALYEADGIIRRSEEHATALFGAARTLYSTEGSSQCIRAMLYLAMLAAPRTRERPVVVAARNVHKAFVLAAALLDFSIVWLWPEEEPYTLCRCPVSDAQLRRVLDSLATPPTAVYITSPDYLGGMQNIALLAAASHAHGVPLLVDNAHGAYLHFLQPGAHPLELGADACCDSAHKTLPVLTGGAYLHIADRAPASFAANARRAMALFGSTSPSYLILQSLDLANRTLAENYPAAIAACAARVARLAERLGNAGWHTAFDEPLKLTLDAARSGWDGTALAAKLRTGGVECEYADPDYVVLMLTPHSPPEDDARICAALGQNASAPLQRAPLQALRPEVRCTVREAIFAPCRTVSAKEACGMVLAAPTVGCPPAVPIAVSGEVLDDAAVRLFAYYHLDTVDVVEPDALPTTGAQPQRLP